MVWTDERIAQLRKLYSEGYTAAAIAVELGFISRNAVCGKIDRLGLNAVPGVPRKKKPSVEKGTVGSVAFGILHRIKAKQNNTRAPRRSAASHSRRRRRSAAPHRDHGAYERYLPLALWRAGIVHLLRL